MTLPPAKYFLISITVSVLFVAISCVPARSPGPDRAALKGYAVRIVRVNGAEVSALAAGTTLPPGPTKIEFTVEQSSFFPSNTAGKLYEVEFTAVENRSYLLKGERASGLCVWDVTGGEKANARPVACSYSPERR